MASQDIEMVNVTQLTSANSTEASTSGNNSCRSSPAVFSVAMGVTASFQQFYIPSLISVGPYHYGRKELSSMESHKDEAVLRMQQRIPGRSMQSIVETEIVERMEQRIHGQSMQEIVEKQIVEMDKNVREFYDKALSYSKIDLAWMVTKDSCFLFEFMLNYLRSFHGKENIGDGILVEERYDAVFSSSLMNPTWRKILYDLALFENQIPLFVLQRLLAIAYSEDKAENILGKVLNKVSKLNSYMVFGWGMKEPYNKEYTSHFLEVSYYRHVGWDLECYEKKALGSTTCIFTSRGVEDRDNIPLSEVKLQTATELNKKGVHFRAVTDKNITAPGVENSLGIRWVRFEEKTSTLYLPQMRIDFSRHGLLRNFIALENTSEKYSPAPITSFAFFMDELVDSEEDVAVLKEANIIKNFFGSNKEAAKCFNGLTMRDQVPAGCKPIDDARVGLHKYLRRKYNILWNEFISTYCAKPWLVAGSLGALLLLLLTATQVICLFLTCNR